MIEWDQILSITFLDSLEGMPSDARDVSNDESGTIMAWVIAADGNGTDQEIAYDMYIAADGKVKAYSDLNEMFSDRTNLRTVSFNGNFDTSDVTDMSKMFYRCTSLESVDVNTLDTSSVTDMTGMFYECNSLISLNVSSFDTSSVTSMRAMFAGCNSLTSLDVSGFNTSEVTTMRSMFESCNSLTSLDVSGFNTSKVTSMYFMFWGCRNLTDLDISGFDMSALEEEGTLGMFTGTLWEE